MPRRKPIIESSPNPTQVVPFIQFCADGTYEVCDEAIEFLSTLKGPLGVISMVGPYRTGKSTLLNRCILKEQVFTVGATVRACTKGILLVKKVLDGPLMENGKPLPVIVIDTEGLGSIDATSTHDTRIFSMALLLSSLFIYNSVGAIDENALSTLSLVTNICKFLKFDGSQDVSQDVSQDGSYQADNETRTIKEDALKNNVDKESQQQTLLQVAKDLGREAFPPLLWLVRDFTLQLVDGNGNSIEPTQYLEQSLNPLDQSRNGASSSSGSTGIAGNIQEKNNVRACIKNCFPMRQCITMVRPVNDESQLQMLSKGIDVPVRDLFQQQMDYVRSFVFHNIHIKKIMDVPTSGKGLITYARAIVQSINEGSHPVIRDAWTLITESQCRDALDMAKSNYLDCLRMEMCWDDASNESIQCFKRHPMPTGRMQTQHLMDLKKFLEQDKERIRKQESQLAESQISTKLSDIDHFILQSADYTDVNQLQMLQTELDHSLKHLTAATENENCSNTAAIDTLRSTLNRLNIRCSAWLHHLCSQVAQWKHQSTIIETELQDKIKALQELELLASATNDHGQEQQKYHEMRQKLTEENEAMLQRAMQAEAQSESLELSMTALQSQKDSIEKKADEFEECVKQFEQEQERYKVEHESLFSQRDRDVETAIRDASHAEQQRYLEQLQKMKADLDRRVVSMSLEFQSATDELNKKLNTSQNHVLQHEAVRKQLLETVSQLRTDVCQLQEHRLTEQITWCKKVGDAEKSVVMLTSQKRRLEEQVDHRLPKRVKTLESECASLKSDLQFKTHEVIRLEKENADVKALANKWQEQCHNDRCKHVEELMRVRCSSNNGHYSRSLGFFESSRSTD